MHHSFAVRRIAVSKGIRDLRDYFRRDDSNSRDGAHQQEEGEGNVFRRIGHWQSMREAANVVTARWPYQCQGGHDRDSAEGNPREEKVVQLRTFSCIDL